MRLLLIGCGNWGSKLAERFASLVERLYLYDIDLEHREALIQKMGVIAGAQEELGWYLLQAEACVIATPPDTHYEIAKRCLEANKHVLVEKPMSLTPTHTSELVSLAQARGLTLMVDDTFMYTPQVLELPIFHVKAMDAYWTGPRASTPKDGILWELGPHPISIMLHVMRRWPVRVIGVQSEREASMVCDFTGNSQAFISLSYNTPVKRRRLYLGGYTDSRSVDFNIPIKVEDPLTAMCRSFVQRVENPPWVDVHSHDVVKILHYIDNNIQRYQQVNRNGGNA